MKQAYLFPGQGSQQAGMGADHYKFHSGFRNRCEQANEILGYSVTEIMFEGPEEVLTQTRYTQPALFIHSFALFEMLSHEPDMVAGHSLGEYTALAAAGVLNFEDALKAVQTRGELMQNAGESDPGTMAAVIGLEDEVVEKICEEVSKATGSVVIPANYNTKGQIVISGHVDAVETAMGSLKDAGAKIVKKLPVSGAFHTSLMGPARDELTKVLDELDFQQPYVSVYSNVSGIGSDDPITIKENLKEQLLSPVRWTQTLLSMYEDGARHYIEVGPGRVLQGLVKRTLNTVEISGFH
ncbi:MAG: ACP S-malonyltransferase [Balneolales bacterium]